MSKNKKQTLNNENEVIDVNDFLDIDENVDSEIVEEPGVLVKGACKVESVCRKAWRNKGKIALGAGATLVGLLLAKHAFSNNSDSDIIEEEDFREDSWNDTDVIEDLEFEDSDFEKNEAAETNEETYEALDLKETIENLKESIDKMNELNEETNENLEETIED